MSDNGWPAAPVATLFVALVVTVAVLQACGIVNVLRSPSTLDEKVTAPIRLEGNWWSDGTYRVDRRDPEDLRQLWYDRVDKTTMLVTRQQLDLDETTATAFDAKCQQLFGNADAAWVGWETALGEVLPRAFVCFTGKPWDDDDASLTCSVLRSRGWSLVLAENRPAEFRYVCREPGT